MAAFLYIEGIKGDATEKDHRGEIELTSYSFPSSGLGRPAGRQGQLTIREISATKKLDSATTALWKAAVSGQIFGYMILDSVSEEFTYRYTMGMVAVTSMQSSAGTESFSLDFETLSIEYF